MNMRLIPLMVVAVMAAGWGPEELADGGVVFRLPDGGFVEMQRGEKDECVADTGPFLVAVAAGHCVADGDCEVLTPALWVRGLDSCYAVDKRVNGSRKLDRELGKLRAQCGTATVFSSKACVPVCESGRCQLAHAAPDGGR